MKFALNLSFVFLFLCVATDLSGQYRMYTGSNRLAPLPDSGVVVLTTQDYSLLEASTYDATGFVESLPVGHLSRLGYDWGYAFNGDRLFYSSALSYSDVGNEELGINGFSIGRDTISMDYLLQRPYMINYYGGTSVGIDKGGESLVVAEYDSVYAISPAGQLEIKFELNNFYERAQVVDVDGVNISASYVIAGMNNEYNPTGIARVELLYHDQNGALLNSYMYQDSLLADWSGAGQAFIFMRKGYVQVGIDTLMSYPIGLGAIEKAYDAEDVAVVSDGNGNYFSFEPATGFVPINRSEYISVDYIVKRSEGWYSLSAGYLTFNPDSLGIPYMNPLALSISVDSASTYVTYEDWGPQIPIVNYSVHYAMEISNTADTMVSDAWVKLLRSPGDFDGLTVSTGQINAGEQVTLPGVFRYRVIGETPPRIAHIYACLIRINAQTFVGGQPPCANANSINVSGSKELGGGQLRTLVYPNPISHEFKIETSIPIRSIRMFDLIGQLVQEFEGNLSGAYQLSGHVSPGLYTLQVYYVNGEKESVKVLVSQ
ncbi:MAG: T9SS type A sorting domain-containing protein [Saprospiraceae bacterium]